jgi:hypothetical protein
MPRRARSANKWADTPQLGWAWACTATRWYQVISVCSSAALKSADANGLLVMVHLQF